MDNKSKRELLYYAAILHDIGKAVERRREKDEKENELYKKYIKQMNNYKIKHPIYSAIFLKKYEKQLKNILPTHINYERLIGHVLNHHSCNSCDDLIVLASDWLSSFERELYEDMTSDFDKVGELLKDKDFDIGGNYLTNPLINVFDNLMGFQNIKNQKGYKIYPRTMDFSKYDEEDYIDRLHLKDMERFGTENYREIFKQLERDIEGISKESQIYALLMKYYWSIPAQTPSKINNYVPDISLFDHLKTSGAIALSLYDEIEHNELRSEIDNYITKRNEENKSTKSAHYFYKYILDSDKIEFMLIHGDLSGIQDFLFNIPSKGAAKSLKGRSTYMNLLMEIVARYIIDSLDLKDANLLYNGGGCFYILAPGCKKDIFETTKKDVSEKIFNAHSNQLYISLSSTIFSPKKFGYFNEVFIDALEETNKEKKTRWKELGHEYFDMLFQPGEEDIKEDGFCRVCNKSLSKNELESELTDKADTCSYCKSLIELTDKIKDCNYEIWTRVEKKPDKIDEYSHTFKSFGYNVDFKKSLDEIRDSEKITSINHFSIEKNIDNFKFAGYKLPIQIKNDSKDGNKASILGLEEMKELSSGAKYIAMLKLDIDNLGILFRDGFAALKKDKLVNSYKKEIGNKLKRLYGYDENVFEYQYRSISRITSLSRMINIFFEGYIPYLIESKYKNYIYLVYSGGDDTVAIGSWDKIIEFHNEIRRKFDDFTCHNYYIDFSSAIGIYPANFNLRMMAYQIENGLKEAKSKTQGRQYEGMIYKGKELKDSIKIKGNTYFMGEVFNRKELDKLIEFKELLKDILKDSHSQEHKALLRKILNSTKGLKACVEKGSINHSKYWRLAYYLRDLNNKENTEKIMDKYTEFLMEFSKKETNDIKSDKKNYKSFKNLMVVPSAVRWSELLFRGDKE